MYNPSVRFPRRQRPGPSYPSYPRLRTMEQGHPADSLKTSRKSVTQHTTVNVTAPDHRSFERQGREQEPTRHMGVSATALERQAARKAPEKNPVTDLGKQNAEIRERNRVLETARKAVEKAQELFTDLEKRARLAVGLARKIGQRMEREREAERQRQELTRQAEIRHQEDIRVVERVHNLERTRSRERRGRSRDRGYDPW